MYLWLWCGIGSLTAPTVVHRRSGRPTKVHRREPCFRIADTPYLRSAARPSANARRLGMSSLIAQMAIRGRQRHAALRASHALPRHPTQHGREKFQIQGMLDNFRSVLFSSCHRGSYRRPCHPTALCDSVRQCNALTPKRAPSLSLFRSRASRCCIDHECAHGLRATLLSLGAFKCSARPEPSARLCVRGIIARAERGNSVQLIRSERISISRLEITAQ